MGIVQGRMTADFSGPLVVFVIGMRINHFHKFGSYDNIISLPVYLSAAGYRTARCGKYHVAPESVYKFQTKIPGNSRSPSQMADNSKAFWKKSLVA